MIGRSGREITTAQILGATSLRIGSAPIERMASTCSVTFMEPSSAVIPEPTRPPTINAVRTGPSSRTSAMPTISPMYILAPKEERA